MNNIIKTVLTVAAVIILFIVALKILKFALAVLLPLAVIIIAAYIVYKLFSRKR